MSSSHQNGGMPQARVKVAHPYLCLMGLYLGGFTGMYSETALNIALPQLSVAFGVELSIVQWMVVGYMLAIGVVLPFSSLLTKWFSARKITLFALGAFLAGSLISGFANVFPIALTGRIIQGAGTGLILPLMFAMVMEVIPPHKIGAAMGANALVIMSASAIGPTLAGILIGAFSWNAIFFSFALVLVVGIFFTAKFLVNPYELTRPHIDPVSVVTSCLGFGGIVLGVGMASLYGWASALVIGALAVGLIALLVYAKRQLNMDDPIIDLRVFNIPGFRTGALCVMLNFGVTLSAMFVLPQFYQNSMLLAVSVAGLVMLPGGVVNAIVSMMSGRIYDRIGARVPALIGFALSIIACALLLFTSPSSPLAYVVCCHIVLMVGVPLAMSPCQTHALSSLPPQLSTDGSTMINTLQQVMGAIATALATFLVATGSSAAAENGATQASVMFSQGAHWGFAFALALAVVSFFLALGFKKQPAHKQETTLTAHEKASDRQADAKLESVASLMKQDVYTLSEDDSALDALKLFVEKGISGAPVVDGKGNLTGFVSDGDILGTLAKQNPSYSSFYAFALEDESTFGQKAAELQNINVARIATQDVITVDIADDMRSICNTLAKHHLKKAPVMDGERMVGIINRSNVTRFAVGLYTNA